MKSIIDRCYKLGLLLLLVVVSSDYGQSDRGSLSPPRAESPFRYVITHNHVDDAAGDGDQPRRVLQVLMEEKAFSEKNLHTLFRLISKRFPTPSLLDVDVATSLDQLATPEELDHGSNSEEPSPDGPKYFWAIYIRSANDEFFRYSPLHDMTVNRLVQLRPKKN